MRFCALKWLPLIHQQPKPRYLESIDYRSGRTAWRKYCTPGAPSGLSGQSPSAPVFPISCTEGPSCRNVKRQLVECAGSGPGGSGLRLCHTRGGQYFGLAFPVSSYGGCEYQRDPTHHSLLPEAWRSARGVHQFSSQFLKRDPGKPRGRNRSL